MPQTDQLNVDLSVGDIRRQIAAEWLDSAIITMESLWKTTIAVSNDSIAVSYDLSFPQNWGPECTPRNNFATRAATWRI